MTNPWEEDWGYSEEEEDSSSPWEQDWGYADDEEDELLSSLDEPIAEEGRPEKGRLNILGGVKDIGKLLYDIPAQTKGSIAGLLEEEDPFATRDWRDKWREAATERTKQRLSELTDEQKKERLATLPLIGDITREDIAETSGSTGFSLASMGASLAGGLAGSPLGGYGAIPAGMAAGGTAAYRMDKNMVTVQLLEQVNNALVEERGTPMTDDERKELLASTDKLRSTHALWEAGPEAVGNALALTGLGKIFTGVSKRFIPKVVGGLTMTLGGELSTETVTEKGQGKAEVGLGMREQEPTWSEAFSDVAAPTALLTGLMGGGAAVGGQIARASDQFVGKLKEKAGEKAANLRAQVEESESSPISTVDQVIAEEETKQEADTLEQLADSMHDVQQENKKARGIGDWLEGRMSDAGTEELLNDFAEQGEQEIRQGSVRERRAAFKKLQEELKAKNLAEFEQNLVGKVTPETSELARQSKLTKEQKRAEEIGGIREAFEDAMPEQYRSAVNEMEKQLTEGETGLRFKRDDDTWDGIKTTNPSWIQQKVLKEHDRVNGTNLAKRLTKKSFKNVINKVRNGNRLTGAQQEIWEYVKQATASIETIDEDYNKAVAEVGELTAPQKIPVGELEPGDKVVIDRHGFPDVVEHKGYDESGNAILEDGSTIHADIFDQIEILGKKKGAAKAEQLAEKVGKKDYSFGEGNNTEEKKINQLATDVVEKPIELSNSLLDRVEKNIAKGNTARAKELLAEVNKVVENAADKGEAMIAADGPVTERAVDRSMQESEYGKVRKRVAELSRRVEPQEVAAKSETQAIEKFDAKGFSPGTPEYDAAFEEYTAKVEKQKRESDRQKTRQRNTEAVDTRNKWRGHVINWFNSAKNGDRITTDIEGEVYEVVEKKVVRKTGTFTSKALVLKNGFGAGRDKIIIEYRDGKPVNVPRTDITIDDETGASQPETNTEDMAASLGKLLEDGVAKQEQAPAESIPGPTEGEKSPDVSQEDMIATAARWQGAARKVDESLGDNKKARLRHSRMTTKGDLDAYLMKRYGIDESAAREISNTLTRDNIPADTTADIAEFKDEAWAKPDVPSAEQSEKATSAKGEFNPLGILRGEVEVPQAKPDTDERLSAVIDSEVERLTAEIANWEGRQYKKSKKVISAGGTVDDFNSTLTTAGAVNERRRRNNIQWREKAITELQDAKKRLETGDRKEIFEELLDSESTDVVKFAEAQLKQEAADDSQKEGRLPRSEREGKEPGRPVQEHEAGTGATQAGRVSQAEEKPIKHGDVSVGDTVYYTDVRDESKRLPGNFRGFSSDYVVIVPESGGQMSIPKDRVFKNDTTGIDWQPITQEQLEEEWKTENMDTLFFSNYPTKEQVERYKEHFFKHIADFSAPEPVTEKDFPRTLYVTDTKEQLAENIKHMRKDVDAIDRLLKTGKPAMPIAIRKIDGSLKLIGGRTRMSLAVMAGKPVTAQVIDEKAMRGIFYPLRKEDFINRGFAELAFESKDTRQKIVDALETGGELPELKKVTTEFAAKHKLIPSLREHLGIDYQTPAQRQVAEEPTEQVSEKTKAQVEKLRKNAAAVKARGEEKNDGVVTVNKYGTSEILDLTTFDVKKAKYAKTEPLPPSAQANVRQELLAKHGLGIKALLKSKLLNIITLEEAQGMLGVAESVHYSADRTIEGFTARVNGQIQSYLVQGGIKKGQAHTVLMHELGSHLYLEQKFQGKQWEAIVTRAKRIEQGDTATAKALQEARKRIPDATPTEHIDSELLAYYIGNQANAKQSLYRKIIAYIKQALIDLGVSARILTPQDLSVIAEAGLQKMMRVGMETEIATGEIAPVFSQAEVVRAAKALYSKLEQVAAERFQGMKAQSVLPFLQKHGVKKAEIEAVGIPEWLAAKKSTDKVSREELLDFVRANAVETEDVILGQPKFEVLGKEVAIKKYPETKKWFSEEPDEWLAVEKGRPMFVVPDVETEQDALSAAKQMYRDEFDEDSEGITKYGSYQMPGAEEGSYREMFVTAPKVGKNERAIEEYGVPYNELSRGDRLNFDSFMGGVEWQDGHSDYSDIKNPIVRIRFNTRADSQGRRILFVEEMQGPNKDNQSKMPAYLRDNIYNLGVKRILAYAKENGFDGVSWTTGEMQRDRYSEALKKEVDSIGYQKRGDELYNITVWGKDGDAVWQNQSASREDIENSIGKELLQKIEAGEGRKEGEITYLEGLDLTVGGEGILHLYDTTLPDMFKAYGKERVGKTVFTHEGFEADYDQSEGESIVDAVPPGSFTVPFLPVTGKTPASFPLFSQGMKDVWFSEAEENSSLSIDRFSSFAERVDPRWRDRWERVVYTWLDWDDPKRLVQNRYGEQPEATNYLAAERLRGKKEAAEVEKFHREELSPLLKFLATSKLEISDLEEYAYAKHVQEANDRLKKVNARRELLTLISFTTGKEQEELRFKLEELDAELEIDSRQEGYLDLLDEEFAKIPEKRRQLEAEKTALDNREWTAAEEEKGTPDRLYRQNEKRFERLEGIVRQKELWDNRKDRLSGITNEEAAEIITKWEGDSRFAKIESARQKLADINQKKLDTLFEAGELTEEQYDSITNMYEFYVPLYREGYEEEGLPARGRTTGPIGKPLQVRAGSLRGVVDILAHSVANRQAAIIRKHRLESGQKLYNLVRENPGAEWWIEESKKEPTFDQGGNITYYPSIKEPANGVHVKIDGKRYTIMVDNHDKTMMRMIKSIKEANVGMGPIVEMLGKVSRLLAALNTSFSPEFMITNFVRDIQTAGINLEDSVAKGAQAAIGKNVLSAVRGIYRTERGKESEWTEIYRDFENNGGKIGWMQSYETIEDLASQLESEMKTYGEGHTLRKNLVALKELVQSGNTAIENGVRLSTYKYLVDHGVSKQKAALTASNLTVDFTRRGAAGQNLNALYMFANAGIQGNVRMIKAAVRSAKVRKLLGGIIGTGYALHFLALMSGGDDDDGIPFIDKVEDSEKERSMIIMLKDGKKVKIPMPYGYNIFFNLGDELAEMTHHLLIGKEYSPLQGMARLGSVFMNSFNPLSSATLLQTIMPTIGDPIAMVAENKTWYGGDLMPEKNPFGIAKPDSERYWKSASFASREIASRLNALTGGDKVKPGKIDVSPETLDLMVDTYTGSAGRFVKNTLMLPFKALEGDLSSRNVPFIRTVFGTQFEGTDANIYRRNADRVLTLKAQVKAAEGERRRQLMQSKEYRLVKITDAYEKRLKKLYSHLRLLESKGITDERADRIKEAIKKRQKKYNQHFNMVISQ